jgi:hypothetical protein
MPEIFYDITRDAFPVTDGGREVAVLRPRTQNARRWLDAIAVDYWMRRLEAAARQRNGVSGDA